MTYTKTHTKTDTNTDTKTDAEPTTSATIPLTFHAGGFVAIELVAPVHIGAAQPSGFTFAGTQASAKVPVTCPELPADTDWKVEWDLGGGHRIQGPQVKSAGGIVEAILDLASGGDALGAFLEAPTSWRLRLTPDYPYAVPMTVEVKLPAPPPLALTIDGKTQSHWGALEGLLVGKSYSVSVTRSSWACHVRLRVDTPGDQDAVVDFAKEKSAATWVVGMHDNTLQLPDPSGGQLPFELVLEVSAEGGQGPWSPLLTTKAPVPLPELVSLGVEIGAGAQRLIGGEDADAAWGDLLADHHVCAVGRFSGFADGFDPPFALELWVARPADGRPGAPLVIQPLTRRRVSVNALHHGEFRSAVDRVSTEEAALHYRGATPFVILRASMLDPLPALERLLAIPMTFVHFSDEDVWRRGEVLGACSSEVANGTPLVRQSVLGALSVAVEKDALAFYCSVLGPLDDWKKTQPTFILESGTTMIERDAKPLEVPNSAKGLLRGEVTLRTLGDFAGKRSVLRVQLGAKDGVLVPEGAGRLEGLVIQPRLGPIEWLVGDDRKVHFICRTAFFPKKSQRLVATLIPPPEQSLHQTVYTGTVSDDGLELSLKDEDGKVCEGLLAEGKLEVRISLPVPQTALDDPPKLMVPPVKERPRRVGTAP